ncbi:MAG: hypothetical protein ABW167_05265 [Baekduia sp.]
MRDSRVALLRELAWDLGDAAPSQPALVHRIWPRWCVTRPGVPNLAARDSYHWRRKNADAAKKRWDDALRDLGLLKT